MSMLNIFFQRFFSVCPSKAFWLRWTLVDVDMVGLRDCLLHSLLWLLHLSVKKETGWLNVSAKVILPVNDWNKLLYSVCTEVLKCFIFQPLHTATLFQLFRRHLIPLFTVYYDKEQHYSLNKGLHSIKQRIKKKTMDFQINLLWL